MLFSFSFAVSLSDKTSDFFCEARNSLGDGVGEGENGEEARRSSTDGIDAIA